MSDNPIEVIELLAMALARAWMELAQLSDTPYPLPDKVRSELEERDALKATFDDLPESPKLGLREEYKKHAAKACRIEDLKIPVDAHVLTELDDMQEVIRRYALRWPELREVLRILNA